MKTFSLFLGIILAGISYAQVGINTSDPSQILDVAGKLEISNDANPATAGAIRFNSSTEDFEGYNGHFWYSLTGKDIPATITSPQPGDDPYSSWSIGTGNTIVLNVSFSQPVDPSTVVVGETFLLEGAIVATGTITWNSDNTALTFQTNETYVNVFDSSCSATLTINGNSADFVRDARGFTLDGDGNQVPGENFVFRYLVLC